MDKKYKTEKKQNVSNSEPVLMPYDMLPIPEDRAKLCYSAIAFLMQPVPGWVQTRAECGETTANVTFQRGFGNLADFYSIASDLMPGAFVEEKSESQLFVTAKLPMLVASSSIDERDVETVSRAVNTSFQRISATVDTNIATDVINDGVNDVYLNVLEVGASSKLDPMQFIKIFDEISGVYMTKAAWDVRTKTWNYEVIIYAK